MKFLRRTRALDEARAIIVEKLFTFAQHQMRIVTAWAVEKCTLKFDGVVDTRFPACQIPLGNL